MQPQRNHKGLQEAFGITLRRFRKQAGLAQERMALESGIDRAYVSGMERGLHNPTLTMIFRLLPLLGVTGTAFCAELEAELVRTKRRRKRSD